jgi:hypothetical protein
MSIFLNTLILFGGSLAIHFVVWKVRLPKRQMKALVIIFALCFLAWLIFSLSRHVVPLAILYVALYFWSVSFCYIITYSAIEADSPTLTLARFIGTSGPKGRTGDEIVRFMDQRPFMATRLTALAKSGLIREQDGRYVISGRESLAFRLILNFRKLYGSIPKGG